MGYGPPQQEAVDAGRIATARKRRGGGDWHRVATAACLSLPLLATATGPDPGIAPLKAATLDLMQAQAKPITGALAVYVGNHDQAMLLDEMRLYIDDAPVRYEYSDLESQALHRGGLHRLLLTTLTPGAHHFRADFAARYADAPPDHWRAAGILDRTITIDAQPAVIELELVKGSYIGKPDLQFHPLKAVGDGSAPADGFVRGSNNDPQLRYAAFLTATERPLAAADELFRLKAEGVPLSQDFSQQLAQTLDAFGAAPRATSADPASVQDAAAAPPYADYNRGVALMRDGNAAEGAVVLTAVAGSKGSDPESAALRDRANLVLGYAQLRNHTGANAVSLFSSVRSPGPYSNAALLGLGWALLAPSGSGQNAQPPQQGGVGAQGSSQVPFQRIPVMLQPHLTDDIAKLKRHEPYRLKQASPPEEQALRRALVPWVELTGRDPLDPAVQEGMIAIPYALNHIGAYEEANDDFDRAIKLLEAADAQLDIAMRRVNAGQMVQALDTREAAGNGWSWWLSAYPREHWWLADDPREPMGAPENFYLQHLMADDGFRAAMQDFHDLHLLSDTLDHLNDADALRARVTAATAAEAKLLQQLAIAELGREQRHTRMYLGEARFALAHMNEPVDETLKPVPSGKAR
ncbi:MAG: hypothetical protein ACHQIO_02860 [Nevskiales bacterium]